MKTPKGLLIPIGGNEAKKPQEKLSDDQNQKVDFFHFGILKEILSEIKKEKPTIEVIPAASGTPDEMEKRYRDAFRKLGLKVGFINFSTAKQADQKENIDRIAKTDAIFFTGGDQDLLVKKLGGTRFLEILKEKYVQEEFLIAGTSAGAMAMSEDMINSGHGDEAMLKGIIQMKQGLGFSSDIIIDSHFLSRGRMSRLTEAVLQKRDKTGIGICEDTGVVISQGDILRAIGSGTITIINGEAIKNTNYQKAKKNDPVYIENLKLHILAKGAAYSIKKKEFVPVP